MIPVQFPLLYDGRQDVPFDLEQVGDVPEGQWFFWIRPGKRFRDADLVRDPVAVERQADEELPLQGRTQCWGDLQICGLAD